MTNQDAAGKGREVAEIVADDLHYLGRGGDGSRGERESWSSRRASMGRSARLLSP
jgi:hypothetical protein